MTVDDFWKKYNHCPFCRYYAQQGNNCYGCMWRFANGEYAKDTDYDGFEPTEKALRVMNAEITE